MDLLVWGRYLDLHEMNSMSNSYLCNEDATICIVVLPRCIKKCLSVYRATSKCLSWCG